MLQELSSFLSNPRRYWYQRKVERQLLTDPALVASVLEGKEIRMPQSLISKTFSKILGWPFLIYPIFLFPLLILFVFLFIEPNPYHLLFLGHSLRGDESAAWGAFVIWLIVSSGLGVISIVKLLLDDVGVI